MICGCSNRTLVDSDFAVMAPLRIRTCYIFAIFIYVLSLHSCRLIYL